MKKIRLKKLSSSLLMFLFLVALSLCCCTWAFSKCSKQVSLCEGFSYCEQVLGTQASGVAALPPTCDLRVLELRLSNC